MKPFAEMELVDAMNAVTAKDNETTDASAEVMLDHVGRRLAEYGLGEQTNVPFMVWVQNHFDMLFAGAQSTSSCGCPRCVTSAVLSLVMQEGFMLAVEALRARGVVIEFEQPSAADIAELERLFGRVEQTPEGLRHRPPHGGHPHG